MINANILVSIFAASLLSGCLLSKPEPIKIYESFKEGDVEWANKPGTSTIKGSGFLKQRGGTVVTCAGSIVSLIPHSPYSRARIKGLFINDVIGLNPVTADGYDFFNSVSPALGPSGYLQSIRRTTCDVDGRFEFENIPSGTYYVTTSVVWHTGERSTGGLVMNRVYVSNDETKTVAVTY